MPRSSAGEAVRHVTGADLDAADWLQRKPLITSR